MAVKDAVGPGGGGGAATVTLAEEVAAVVPAAPTAVSVNVVVPTVLNVNCIPGWFTGFPSRATELPFCDNVTLAAFVVVQLTVTLSPACTLPGVTVIVAVGFTGAGGGVGVGFGVGEGVGVVGVVPGLELVGEFAFAGLLSPRNAIQPSRDVNGSANSSR